MAVSKVILNGETLIDTTQKTVTAGSMLSGTTALKNDGTDITGNIASKSSTDLTVSGATVTAPAGYYGSAASKSVASGTEGIPTATKGTVSNHAVSVTPSVTNTTGYITGGTKNGTAVTVSASELVSGTLEITSNGEGVDVTDYAFVDVDVEPDVSSLTVTPTESQQVFTGGGSVGDQIQTFSWRESQGQKSFTNALTIGTTYHAKVETSTNGGFTWQTQYDDNFVCSSNAVALTAFVSVTNTAVNQTSLNYDYVVVTVYELDTIDGYLPVTVNAIPSEYVIPSGTLSITQNGVSDVTNYASVDVNVSGGGGDNTFALELINRTVSSLDPVASQLSSVGAYAFASCLALTDVNLSTCVSIGSCAFAYATNLSNLSLPVCTTLFSSAFLNCTNLKNAYLPMCSSVAYGAFSSCNNLETVTLSTTVSSMYYYAFANCSKLTSIYGMTSVKNVGEYVFYHCDALSSIPQINNIISTYAFRYCTGLTGTLKLGVSTLGAYAFANCTGLQSVYFSPAPSVVGAAIFSSCTTLAYVTYIGGASGIPQSCFYGCTNLAAVYMFSGRTNNGIYSSAFYGCSKLMSLYVLDSTVIILRASTVFINTPMVNSTFTGNYGSIFVPESLYSGYIVSNYWSSLAARFASMTSTEIEALQSAVRIS